jgi:hypothetical protein
MATVLFPNYQRRRDRDGPRLSPNATRSPTESTCPPKQGPFPRGHDMHEQGRHVPRLQQSTCACAHIIFASFTPLKSIHHLLHASTDLSSLLLLMCVPGTTRGAGWGCALCFPWVLGTLTSQGPVSRALYKNACRQDHRGRPVGGSTWRRACRARLAGGAKNSGSNGQIRKDHSFSSNSPPFDFDEHARYMSLDDHENAPALDLVVSEASM